MKKKTLIAVTFCLAISLSMPIRVNAGDAPPVLVSADWSVNATHNLASNPPSLEVVKDFENRFWGASEAEAKEIGDDVCEFRFADLRGFGNLSLIVMVGSKNSRFGCTKLDIFDRVPTGFELYSSDLADAAVGHDLAHSVLDINHDGRHELVLWADLAPFATGTAIGQLGCDAEWPLVFAWSGNSYSDVSDQYKKYYRGYLKSVNSQLATYSSVLAAAASPTSNTAPEIGSERSAEQTQANELSRGLREQAPGRAVGGPVPVIPASAPEGAATPAWVILNQASVNYPCTKIEAAKTEAFLGIDSASTMSAAIKDSESDDPNKRIAAAVIFSFLRT